VVLTALWGVEAFEIPEPFEGLNEFLCVGQDGDGIRLETGAGSLAGFELAVEEEAGKGNFFFGRLKDALKKISAGSAW
jgi:hypothetical protein